MFGKPARSSRKLPRRLAANRPLFRSELKRNWLRPQFETLEDRRLLAVVTWDGGGDGVTWEGSANWDTDTLPTAADDVVIADLPSLGATFVTLNSAQQINLTHSALRLIGTTVMTTSITIGEGSFLDGAGTTIFADVINNQGGIAWNDLGLVLGPLIIDGQCTHGSNASFYATVDPIANTAGQVQVVGTATLDGFLDLTTSNPLDYSQSFVVLTFASASGNFLSQSWGGPGFSLATPFSFDLNPGSFPFVPGSVAVTGAVHVVSSSAEAGPGSLREAIQDANAQSTAGLIGFRSTVGTINLASPLPVITNSVEVNATVIGSYLGTPVIELDGSLAGPAANGLRLGAGSSGSVISGLAINRFSGSGIWIDSSNNEVSGNYIGTNTLQGINIGHSGSVRNTLAQGNYIGTDISGAIDIGNAGRSIELASGASRTKIRGNTISGNDGGGVLLSGATSEQNLIAGNKLGTNACGDAAIPNGQAGPGNARYAIELDAASNNTIGGTVAADRNLISGNIGDGVNLQNGASRNTVQGNWIGVDVLGLTAIPNTVHAVHLRGATTANNTLGGAVPAAGNLLAYSGGSAFRLDNFTSTTSSGNTFDNNSYRENLGLAIDVGAAGLTLNDGLDGATDLRDFPVLEEVLIDQSNINDPRLILKGLAEPGRRLQFFVITPTANGRGQGAEFIATKIEGFIGTIAGPDDDLDAGTGTYAAPYAASTLTANRFEFNISLPASVRYGSPITGLALGSISKFGNVVQAGLAATDAANNLAPVVSLGTNVVLTTGGELQLQGSFVDDDSTSSTATVDYGDGSGIRPLTIDSVSRSFALQHEYNTSQRSPFTVIVTVLDNGGRVGTAGMTVTVQNETPVATYNEFSITSIVNEGGRATF